MERFSHRSKRSSLIRLKRIYNFWCSMLVFALFALCFVTLRGIFMHFPELTYWRDATVPVPCFLLFLCFGKAKQEIFLKLDETKPEPPIFPAHKTRTKGEPEGGQGSATPRARAPPCPYEGVVWAPWPPSDATSPPI
jgi:hypothetical protein